MSHCQSYLEQISQTSEEMKQADEFGQQFISMVRLR
jgi:hypothetical protein